MYYYISTSTNFQVLFHALNKYRTIEKRKNNLSLCTMYIFSVCCFFLLHTYWHTQKSVQRLMKQGLQTKQQILMGKRFIRHHCYRLTPCFRINIQLGNALNVVVVLCKSVLWKKKKKKKKTRARKKDREKGNDSTFNVFERSNNPNDVIHEKYFYPNNLVLSV